MCITMITRIYKIDELALGFDRYVESTGDAVLKDEDGREYIERNDCVISDIKDKIIDRMRKLQHV